MKNRKRSFVSQPTGSRGGKKIGSPREAAREIFRFHPPLRSRRGFLLIRVLVAMVILTVLGLRILDGLAAAKGVAVLVAQTDAAVLLAQAEMEWLRSQDPAVLPAGRNQPFRCGLPFPGEISGAVGSSEIVEATPGILHATVRVRWEWQRNPRMVRLDTFLAVSGEGQRGGRP